MLNVETTLTCSGIQREIAQSCKFSQVFSRVITKFHYIENFIDYKTMNIYQFIMNEFTPKLININREHLLYKTN